MNIIYLGETNTLPAKGGGGRQRNGIMQYSKGGQMSYKHVHIRMYVHACTYVPTYLELSVQCVCVYTDSSLLD